MKENRNINYAEVLGDGPKMTLHTWTEEVVDATATAEAISSCKTNAQQVIDDIKAKIEEYDTHIEDINNMITEIGEKRTLMETVGSSFSAAQGYVDKANINVNFDIGCKDCLENLGTQFDAMEKDCTTKLEEYTTKKTDAETELTEAEASLTACSDIEVKKTVTRSAWW